MTPLYSKKLSTSPAKLFYVAQRLALAEAGLADFHYQYDWEVLYLEDSGKVIAACVFEHVEWEDCLLVRFGATMQAYRLQGLYKILWSRVVEIAKERGCNYIESGFDPRNKESQAMHDSLSRPVVTHLTRFNVLQENPDSAPEV